MSRDQVESKVRAWAGKRPWFAAFAAGTGFSALQADSLEAVRFVAYLQGEFRITIEPEDFFGGAFDSLEALVAFIHGRGIS